MNTSHNPDAGIVLPCAGTGTRVGAARPKQFLDLGGRPVFHRPLTVFLGHPRVLSVVLVVAPEERRQVQVDLSRFYASLMAAGRLVVVDGGAQRWESVKNGVSALPEACRLVVVHDVARPFVNARDIDGVLGAAQEDGASSMAIPSPDTIKWIAEGPAPSPLVEKTLDRARIWLTQTPQAFGREILEDCYRRSTATGDVPTDEAGLVESFGHPVRLVRGAERLRKITTSEDLEWARWMATRSQGGSGIV
jgi:2-C-methyl-D-erythritol 4-phosphate cytidylyltransferase